MELEIVAAPRIRVTPRILDALLAKAVFDMDECRQWRPVNYGSAGGPAFLKNCAHELGKCYSHIEIQMMHGLIGGPPSFTTNGRDCVELIRGMDKLGFRTVVVVEDSRSAAFTARVGEVEGHLVEDTTIERAVALSAAHALGLEVEL